MINLINSNNLYDNKLFETDILIIGSGISCLSFIDFFLYLNTNNHKKKITIIEKGKINKTLLNNKRANIDLSHNHEKFTNEGSFKFDLQTHILDSCPSLRRPS